MVWGFLLFWFFLNKKAIIIKIKLSGTSCHSIFILFAEEDVFDSIQMNCHCFDYLYKSSPFTKRTVEGNKLVACISYFGQFL